MGKPFMGRLLLTGSALIMLNACGGGGSSGSSPSQGTTGSATFSSLSYSSINNTCFSPTGFGTAASCSVSGTPSNQTSTATCSAGTPIVICRVGGFDFSLVTSGSSSADAACVAAGGSVQVTCKITTNGACTTAGGAWTAANNPDVSTPSNCSNAGGTYFSTLQSLTGSLTSANLTAGSNLITADPSEVATALNLFNGVMDLDNTNLSLVSISATAAIGNYWEHAFYMTSPSVYNFRSTSIQFSVVSPLATSDAISIKANTAKVSFQ